MKFFIVAQWNSPTYLNSYGIMVYDFYVRAWDKDTNEIFMTFKYDTLESENVFN